MVKFAEAAEEFLFIYTSVNDKTTTICWGKSGVGFHTSEESLVFNHC